MVREWTDEKGTHIEASGGYTIMTPRGTLWCPLPAGYTLTADIVKDDTDDTAYGYVYLRRTSPNPEGRNLRRNFIAWRHWDTRLLRGF